MAGTIDYKGDAMIVQRIFFFAGMVVVSALVMGAGSARALSDMSFDVNITLSIKAAAKLAMSKESIVVLASFYGDPKRSAVKHANEVGQIDLSPKDETVEITGTGGNAHISGATVEPERLQWLHGPSKVNVNVASARKSNSDNLLDCDFIDGPLADIRKVPVTLHCYLIEEPHPDTHLKP